MYLTLINIANLLQARVFAAIATIPGLLDVYYLLGAISIYGVLAIFIGFKFKFLEFSIERNWSIVMRVIITAWFAPAILEELFFRVILLPHPSEKSSLGFLLTWIIVSLVLFVVYHPLNGATLFVARQKTFSDPIFLILAASLGVFCTFIYLNSGSLWTPAVFHWIVVVVWLLYFGGKSKLMQQPEKL